MNRLTHIDILNAASAVTGASLEMIPKSKYACAVDARHIVVHLARGQGMTNPFLSRWLGIPAKHVQVLYRTANRRLEPMIDRQFAKRYAAVEERLGLGSPTAIAA